MQLPGETTVKVIVDLIVTVAVIALIVVAYKVVTAGKDAELNAARGNNAALAEGVKGQNKAIDDLKKGGDARKAKSKKAVEAAGKNELEDAARILATPAAGETALERAANRINAEFGR